MVNRWVALRARLDLPIHWVRRAVIPQALRSRRVARVAATPGVRRTLYIDLSVISVDDAGTGIQRVVRALALILAREEPEGWDIRFVGASRTQPYHCISWGGSRYDSTVPMMMRARPGDVFVGLDYALDTVRWHRSQLSLFRRMGGQLWFLVHDLLPAHRPDWFSPLGVLRNRIWLDAVAALGDGFLCNSYQTEADLAAELRHYGLHPSMYQTCVLPMGYNIADALQAPAAPGYATAHDHIRALAGRPFFLVVGTLEPRKGHAELIRAFDLIWERGSNQRLVLIGRLGWRVEALKKTIIDHLEYGRRLIWLDDIDDVTLMEAYRACEGVLVASLAEGFGLTLIEALGYGKPVLARDLPVFQQHAGEGVRYFPVDASPEVLADHILQWREAIRAGVVVVRTPRSQWREAAQILLAAVTS
ncbi:glycosyltransferase family 4 protein [Sphingomonas sp. PB4P5]|uniref:glycosyltransferase family 4 protein n=1 Tax=Parasphingomonas puruogangriensis TaxID=3096155 RepID=UPI002FCC89FB